MRFAWPKRFLGVGFSWLSSSSSTFANASGIMSACRAMSWRATHVLPEGLRASSTAARVSGSRGEPLVVYANRGNRSRSKKSASPIVRKKGLKSKNAPGGAAVSTAPPPVKHPNAGPVMEIEAKQTLAEILAQDQPMRIIKPPSGDRGGSLPGGGGGLRYGEAKDSKPELGSWADALADFRSEGASFETNRNAAKRTVLDEEESLFVVGSGKNFVAYGRGEAANDDEWDEDDDDEEMEDDPDVFERDEKKPGMSALEKRYKQGQAAGAVEFELGEEVEDDDDGWDDEENSGTEIKERGIPFAMRCFDTAKVFVKAGDGGRGMVAFRREAFVAQGGPYGGNGGNGGAVFFEANDGINSLVGFRKKVHHRAEPGGNGGGKRMQGQNGNDRVVLVPPGTVIRDSKNGAVLAEMFQHGHREMVIPGGRGGRGNASFKTSKNKAPQIAENGEEGIQYWIEMELKLVADVGIIGVPNAGKSTLLANVSNAKPKIADYPFTTIVPNLGVVERDFERMVFADIPGLLEGASEGIGLGFEFLRHVKRTRVLVHVLDCTSKDVLEEYDAIRNEIFLFDPEVGDKPELIALNKVDVSSEASERALELQHYFKTERGIGAHVISAAQGQGVEALVMAIKEVWQTLPSPDYAAEALAAAERRIARPADGKSLDDFSIKDTPYAFVVEGAAIERFVQMTNWDYFESFKRFAQVLTMSGVEKALNEAGAGEGDRVVIGKYEFEWSDDRRESNLFESWKAKQDEKPAGTTLQGTRHWPH